MTDMAFRPRDEDVESTKYAVPVERFAETHRFRDLHEIDLTGSWKQQEIAQKMKAYAEENDIGLGDLKVEWTLRIEAIGYRLPKEVEEKFATFADPEAAQGADEEFYREQVQRFLDMARAAANAPDYPRDIVVEFLMPRDTEEPPGPGKRA